MTATPEYAKKQASITTRLIKAAKSLGLNSATASGTPSVVLGVYVYLFKAGNYAGRSMNMSSRLGQHALGKLPMATIQKQVFIAVNQAAARGTPGYDLHRVLEQIAIEVAEGMKSKGGYNSMNGIDKSKCAKAKPGTDQFKAYQKYLKCK